MAKLLVDFFVESDWTNCFLFGPIASLCETPPANVQFCFLTSCIPYDIWFVRYGVLNSNKGPLLPCCGEISWKAQYFI